MPPEQLELNNAAESTQASAPAAAPAAPDAGAPAAPAQADVTPASSPAAEGVKEPTSSLEKVKREMAQQRQTAADQAKAGEQAAGESPKPEGEAQAQQDPDAEHVEPSDVLPAAEVEKLSRNAKRRIRQLTKLNETAQAQIQALQPAAQHFQQIRQFVIDSGMQPQEFQNLLAVGRMIKADPHAALEQMRGYVAQLEEMVGAGRLPPDLQADVEAGRLAEERARELSVARNRTQFLQTQRQSLEQRGQEREQQHQTAAQVNAIRGAVAAWETQVKTSDPDFAKLGPLVSAEVHQLIAQEGIPSTPQGAVEQAKKAYDNVRKAVRAFSPSQPKAIQTVTGGTSGPTMAQPKSSREAAAAALAGMRR